MTLFDVLSVIMGIQRGPLGVHLHPGFGHNLCTYLLSCYKRLWKCQYDLQKFRI